MDHEARNISLIEHITRYCELTEKLIKRFGNTKDAFMRDVDYQHCCAMYIFQIGELSTHLTDAFREAYQEIPWRAIRDMRNFFAHEYLHIDLDIVWETVMERVPELYEKCVEILRQYEVSNESGLFVKDDKNCRE
jgi:uncharacterized protein with HEPN domain